MGFIDDMRAKLSQLDKTGDGKVDFEDLKHLADEHGMGDKVDGMRDQIAGPDGKVTVDDAKRVIGDLGHNVSEGVNSLKDKFFK